MSSLTTVELHRDFGAKGKCVYYMKRQVLIHTEEFRTQFPMQLYLCKEGVKACSIVFHQFYVHDGMRASPFLMWYYLHVAVGHHSLVRSGDQNHSSLALYSGRWDIRYMPGIGHKI